jgi:sigma-B regulation protein RsbU (phosphoserine phosphatase)
VARRTGGARAEGRPARGERAALELRRLAAELDERDAQVRQLEGQLSALVARMTEELRLASAVQRSLLPAPVQYSGLDVAREFIPFREVGGDYYDFLPLGPDRLALALGDVMGKGIPAALLAAGLKAAVRSQLPADERALAPEEVVCRVNQLFREIAPPSLFSSLFFGVFDTEDGVLEYVNAGHHYPFCVRRDGAVVDLATGGTLLGLMEGAGYERGAIELERGDLLVFYTDGVTDRTDLAGEAYGSERLKEAARRQGSDSARLALYSLLGDVQGFSAGTPADDDATLVLVRVR